MKGLMLKDLIILKKSFKSMSFILIAFAVLFIPMGNDGFFSGMIILIFTMMVVTTISYDDLAKWDTYALTMPISREEIVRSKYFIMLILDFSSAVLATCLGIIGFIITGSGFKSETFLSIFCILLIAVIFGSILLPLIYKFGTEKARIIIVLCAAIPTAVFLVLAQLNIPYPIVDNERTAFLISVIALVFISVVGLIASYMISVKIYKKKEF